MSKILLNKSFEKVVFQILVMWLFSQNGNLYFGRHFKNNIFFFQIIYIFGWFIVVLGVYRGVWWKCLFLGKVGLLFKNWLCLSCKWEIDGLIPPTWTYRESIKIQNKCRQFRARSQIPVYSLTGRDLGLHMQNINLKAYTWRISISDQLPYKQNLVIECIPYVGTYLCITMAAKSTLSYCQIYWCE